MAQSFKMTDEQYSVFRRLARGEAIMALFALVAGPIVIVALFKVFAHGPVGIGTKIILYIFGGMGALMALGAVLSLVALYRDNTLRRVRELRGPIKTTGVVKRRRINRRYTFKIGEEDYQVSEAVYNRFQSGDEVILRLSLHAGLVVDAEAAGA